MNVLSIQSAVAYGHAGNSAAVFPLQRRGVNVWPLHTVFFSNHAGYPSARGQAVAGAHLADVFRGIAERGVLADCDAVLSGYLGALDQGAVVLDAVARVKEANPRALYCCDPVIGDVEEGVYVSEGVSEFFRDKALAVADIVTPNAFELSFLTGRVVDSIPSTLAAAGTLMAGGPSIVVVTSFHPKEMAAETISVLALQKREAWLVTTPYLESKAKGAGDVFTALLLAELLAKHPLKLAIERTCAAVFGVVAQTAAKGARELCLIEGQEQLVNPKQHFQASRIEALL